MENELDDGFINAMLSLASLFAQEKTQPNPEEPNNPRDRSDESKKEFAIRSRHRILKLVPLLHILNVSLKQPNNVT